jgi:hypothetical protein
MRTHQHVLSIPFLRKVGGGVELGLLGTAATNRPIVSASCDYDGEIGGVMIGRGNRSTRRKPVSMPLCPPQNTRDCPDANPGHRGGNSATNRLSYGTAYYFPLGVFVTCDTSRDRQ